jgi:penicillin amidase
VDLETTSYAVSGPQASVEILIDRWGVPHVYASSRYDAFSPRVRATADERSRPLRKDG